MDASYAYFVEPLALGEKPVLLGERDGRPEAAPGGLCLTTEDVGAIAKLFRNASEEYPNIGIPLKRIIYMAKAFAAMHEAAAPTAKEEIIA